MHVGGRDRTATEVCDELHDELLPMLAVALQDLDEAAAGGGPEELGQAQRSLQACWDLARGALVGWHPEETSHELGAALRTAVGRARCGSSLQVLLHVQDGLTTAHHALVVRAVAELVGNVVRHAGAVRCDAWITQSGGRTLVAVFDDGRGFADPGGALAPDAPGRGLVGLDQALRPLGGHLSVAARAHGTVVRLVVPEP